MGENIRGLSAWVVPVSIFVQTTTAKALLASIMEAPKTPEEIARKVAVPLFKVRSSLREMKSMGFVKETAENQYLIHEQAKNAGID